MKRVRTADRPRRTQDVGECGIDLDDRALLVADEECLLQRIDQRRPPTGVVVTQPREFDVGSYAREQFGSREGFDEVVVGAGLKPFDRGLLPCAGGQQHHRHGRGARIGPQRRHQGESVQPGHHHVADNEVGHDSADRLQGLLTVGHGIDLVSGAAKQAAQVFTHVGVVVCDEDPRRRVAARSREVWRCQETPPTRRPRRDGGRCRLESSAALPAHRARPRRKPRACPQSTRSASAGRCEAPNGRRIVNVVPAPSALSAVDGAVL